MKGPEVGARYPDPALRPCKDLDLLVENPIGVQRALRAAGFVPTGTPHLYEGIHHLRPLYLPGLPVTIEVHARPKWPDHMTAPPAAELIEAAVPSTLGVPGLLTLPVAHHAVVLAAHAWAHDPLACAGRLIDVAADGARGRPGRGRRDRPPVGLRAAVAHHAPSGRGARGGRAAPGRDAAVGAPPERLARAHGARGPHDAHRRRAVGPAAPQGGALRDHGDGRELRGARPASRGRRSWDGRARRSATRSCQSRSTTSGRGRSSRRRSTRRGRARDRAAGSATRAWRGRRSTARSWRSTSTAAVYLAANPAGALLWRTLAGGATREALVAELMREYGIDRDRAGADTDAFLRDLRERGLLDG